MASPEPGARLPCQGWFYAKSSKACAATPELVDSGMEEYIRHLLQTYSRRELSVPGRRLAAVLLPLYQHNGDYGLIFTQR